jgi:nucleoid-associated protein YgaU
VADAGTSGGRPPFPVPHFAPRRSMTARSIKIKSGDTPSAIAKQFHGDANRCPAIFDANREVIKDANLIFPGQKIRIPPL